MMVALVAHRFAQLMGLVLNIVRLPIYAASGVLPRDPRVVVFGADRDRFTDNARYLFLALAGQHGLRTVWITGDRALRDRIRSLGREAHLRWSPRGMAAAARAGWHVYNANPRDTNFWLSRSAQLFNLWHGIPIKTIKFDVTNGPHGRLYHSKLWSPRRLRQIDSFRRPDYLLSTSPFVTTCFSSAFRTPRDRCLELGYPRTDHLFDPDARQLALHRSGLPGSAVRGGVIGYFPTFRDDEHDFLGAAGWSFARLNARLARVGRTMIFKAHPLMGPLAPATATWSNVIVLDATADLNEVLPACDALVTDHSSVAFDFLLLGRPIVYFLPDRERYESLRNTYFTIEEMAVGPIVSSCAELEELLAEMPLHGPPDPRIGALRERVWGAYAGGACEAIASFLTSGAVPDHS